MKRLLWAMILAALLVAVFVTLGYRNAIADPIVRQASVEVADWPKDAAPLRVLSLSDIHVAGPDMPPSRLRRIVAQMNTLKPDLVVIPGDLISEKRMATHIYSVDEIAEPLGDLKAPLGVIVVPGNHDHWAGLGPIEAALQRQGVTVLKNTAIRRGPVRIVGIDDEFSGHDDIAASIVAVAKLARAPIIVVTHSPDVIPDFPIKADVFLAGHTHCGQISLPVMGAPAYFSKYGDRFACGDITDKGRRIFIGAGLGTSILPLRFGAPPDVWLVTLRAPE